jgi:ribonuclease J
MKIIIHRGNREIGASCIEVQTAQTRVIFDVGLELEGEPAVVPQNIGGVAALFITHAHPDHYGLVSKVPPGIPAYCGALTEDLMRIMGTFNPRFGEVNRTFEHFANGEPVRIDDITITPYATDHSVPDSYAFHVEADGKRILISGDFRAHGRKAHLMEICARAVHDPDAMVVDGTCVVERAPEQQEPKAIVYNNEKEVEDGILKVLRKEQLPAFIDASSINVDRMVSAFKAARRAGRIFAVDIYSALILWIMNKRYGRIIPINEWEEFKVIFRRDLTGHQEHILLANQKRLGLGGFVKTLSGDGIVLPETIAGNPSRYLIKFNRRDELIEKIGIGKYSYIYSMWSGYMSPRYDQQGRFQTLKESPNVRFHFIHTSGHATWDELCWFINNVAPKKLIPFHTNYPEGFRDKYPDAIIGEREIEV